MPLPKPQIETYTCPCGATTRIIDGQPERETCQFCGRQVLYVPVTGKPYPLRKEKWYRGGGER